MSHLHTTVNTWIAAIFCHQKNLRHKIRRNLNWVVVGINVNEQKLFNEKEKRKKLDILRKKCSFLHVKCIFCVISCSVALLAHHKAEIFWLAFVALKNNQRLITQLHRNSSAVSIYDILHFSVISNKFFSAWSRWSCEKMPRAESFLLHRCRDGNSWSRINLHLSEHADESKWKWKRSSSWLEARWRMCQIDSKHREE